MNIICRLLTSSQYRIFSLVLKEQLKKNVLFQLKKNEAYFYTSEL